MEHVFAVRDAAQLLRYQEFVSRIQPRLECYIEHLKQEYALGELPRVIIWTDRKTATEQITDIPVPAYTNEYRVVFTPDLDAWRDIYLRQLDGLEESTAVQEIRNYYNEGLTENHVLQILGHELAHHSGLFLDGFDTDYDSGIWFEEGIVEYISRRFFLTEEQFTREAQINRALVHLHRSRYGNHSLEEFGKETYSGDFASIFFEYWRAFLAVSGIVERFDGDVRKVFQSYHQWDREGRNVPLSQWFSNE